MITTDDLLRAIAQNAYEYYSNTIAPMTPAQQQANEFMTTLKPGYWVLETSSQRRWLDDILHSIGRMIWSGKLPIPDWNGEEGDRPFDNYTIIQLVNGDFSWWWNASFIRVFSGDMNERSALSGLFVSPERKRALQGDLDLRNLYWAKDTLLEHRLSGVLDENFEGVILDYAQKYYDEKVDSRWHPWDVLSLFPAKTTR